MNSLQLATVDDVLKAEPVLRRYLSPSPLIRSYALEKHLGMPSTRRIWLKDYGWTPSGSFKVMGALNWVYRHQDHIGERPVAAHSSGNFASGLAFACREFKKRVIILMPENAPRVKFELTRSFGAEVRTYDITRDHETGDRDRKIREIAEQENGIMASPYDDNAVIAGNGVGAMEIVLSLQSQGRGLSHFLCPVSGGGLMAGHVLTIFASFPESRRISIEPANANDFERSMASGSVESLPHPTSICDGLLSYSVGQHNWPLLHRHVTHCLSIDDAKTKHAMRWLYENHGLRTEPSGAISVAALLFGELDLSGDRDIVAILSGRNIDEDRFKAYCRDSLN